MSDPAEKIREHLEAEKVSHHVTGANLYERLGEVQAARVLLTECMEYMNINVSPLGKKITEFLKRTE